MMWLILVIAAFVAIVFCMRNALSYWRDKGVPQSPVSWYLLEIVKMFRKHTSMAETVQTNYNKFPDARYYGFYQFTQPILMIRDPDLLREVTVKSFENFTDHSNFMTEDIEPLWARNLFALKGKKWREMRPILSPSFTSSKMRSLFVLISQCAERFSEHFLKKNEPVIEVEFKDMFTRFTNDVIATSAFGVSINSLEDQTNDFYLNGKRLMAFGKGVSIIFKFILLGMLPKLFHFLRLTIFDKSVMQFFTTLINDTLKIRKEKRIVRPDMIHLLMEAQKGLESKEEAVVEDSSFAAQEESDLGGNSQTKEHKEMTNMDIAAQALIFFFAGFETVSSLMCFMAYELAVHPDYQSRLRDEIQDTLDECGGNVTYEALLKMKYLDMVVSESLRKWPGPVAVDRECTRPYTIEPKLPGEKPVHLAEKSLVWIPIFGIHRNPKFYPEPETFDPERFNDENKDKIIPYSYLPFGLGPRNCIGSRFALLEIKIVFFHLLRNFELVPTAKSQIPVQLSPESFSLDGKDGFWFALKRLVK